MSLKKQMAALIAIMALGLIAINVLTFSIIKSNLIESRKHEIETVLRLAKAQVSAYVTLEKTGNITRAQAEQKVIEILSNIRSGDSYIWANGHDAISKVHPNPEQLGSFQASYKSSLIALRDNAYVFSEGQYPKSGASGLFHKINGMTKIPEWDWVFGYGIYIDDLQHDISALLRDFIIASCSILAVIVLFAMFISRLIVQQLFDQIGGDPKDVATVTNSIANGNLNVQIKGEYRDESLLGSVARMQSSLSQIVDNIHNIASTLQQSIYKLNSEMNVIAQASQESSDNSEATTQAIQNLSSSVEDISDSVNQTKLNSENCYQLSTEAEEFVKKSAKYIDEISQEINQSSQGLTNLQSRSVEVGNIVNVIREIADQTNLLALNAAIEAARAGDSGRGFAVVADEVRTLASRTAAATAEINQTIKLTQSDTEDVMKTMGTVMPKVEANVEVSDKVASMLTDIRHTSSETLTQVSSVSQSTDEQMATSQSLSVNTEQISETMQATAQSIQNSHQNMVQLEQMADDLLATVSYFKVK